MQKLEAGSQTARTRHEVADEMKAAILTDTTKCNGCHECVAACKKENHSPLDLPRRWDLDDGLSARNWTSIVEGPQHAFVRKQCRHCLEPACASACPVGALHKTSIGAVVYDAQVHGLPLLHDGLPVRHSALRMAGGGPLRPQVHSLLRPNHRRTPAGLHRGVSDQGDHLRRSRSAAGRSARPHQRQARASMSTRSGANTTPAEPRCSTSPTSISRS